MGGSAAGKLGPDLSGTWRNGPDYFIENIVDPNAVIGDAFQLTIVTLKDGTSALRRCRKRVRYRPLPPHHLRAGRVRRRHGRQGASEARASLMPPACSNPSRARYDCPAEISHHSAMTPLRILAAGLVLLTRALPAASTSEFALRDGDTVAFLGDSITAARDYSKLIETYTVLRFPERKIRFVNAGRGGETAKGSLLRLDEAVFAKGATVLTVAYGVNDIGWGTKADAAHKAEYLDGLATIIDRCRDRGVRVFICSAAITAEAPDTAEAGFLQEMCDEGLVLARSKGAGTIDVQRGMREVQRRVLAANATQPDRAKHISLHVGDGVHLNDLGQMAMGYSILKGLGAPADVSTAELDAQDGTVIRDDGCVVSEVRTTGDSLAFTRLDDRLPLNQAPLWMLHGFYIPLGDQLNRYNLSVAHLPEGRYDVLAGGRPLGTWSASELSAGISIASATADPWQPGGPWHAQGHAVKALTDLRDTLDFTRRDMAAFLGAHPRQTELMKTAATIEENLIALQRDMARPVPVDFVIRRADPKAAE